MAFLTDILWRSKVTRVSLVLFWLGLSSVSAQQIGELVQSVEIRQPASISMDRKGKIYIADEEGNINRYDPSGNFELNYSPQKIGQIHLMEGWFSIRLFAFYRDYQEYLFLDRFLTPSPVYSIPQELVGFARVATLGNDDNIWIVDDSDISLKKLDKNVQFLIYNIQLNNVLKDEDHDINFIREYQNQLFINNSKEGLMVFDNLGNYKYQIPETGLEYLSFRGDELIYLKSGQLFLYDIYSQKKRSIEITSDTPYVYALSSDDFLYLIAEDKMDVFKFSP